MNLPVVLRDEAQAEFDAAVDWYEARAGLGADLIAEVQAVFDRIAANPRVHQAVYQTVRRARVRRFPYLVLYEPEPSQVTVLSVFHTSRDPAEWQRRV